MVAPIILRQGEYKLGDIEKLRQIHQIWRTIDVFEQQQSELQEIGLLESSTKAEHADTTSTRSNSFTEYDELGDWIYFPWNGHLVHMVTQADYFKLRTNRNQLLITTSEQQKLSQATVGFAGLSIGSHFVLGLAYSGIGGLFKIADMDVLSTSNLNRVKAGITSITAAKVEIVTQQVLEINPYQDFELYEQGLGQEELDQFLAGRSKPELIFEAVDDFRLKVLLRLKAKELGIPVIMLTNLGDSLLIDIERYDNNPHLSLFNGKLNSGEIEALLKTPVSELNLMKYILNLLGTENLPTRVLASLNQLGTTLVGRPQLNGTVTIGGGIATYIARQIILGGKLESGRYKISLDQAFNSDDDMFNRDEQLASLLEKVKK